MKLYTGTSFALCVALSTSLTTAFSPTLHVGKKALAHTKVSVVATGDILTTDEDNTKELYDPLGLYPQDSPERKAGLLKPLEVVETQEKVVADPLNLYPAGDAIMSSSTSSSVEMSASIPFLKRPQALDGTLAGDRGFDPFHFASDADSLAWQRVAELKHARLAMLAAVGWPLAELYHNPLAQAWGLPNALNANDRVPSVLNGGLGNVSPIFWVAALTAAAVIETVSGAVGETQSTNLGFDPLGIISSKEDDHDDGLSRYMEESEIFNGRLAMLAITGFAVQEWFTNNSVVDAIPIFFKPFNIVVEQLMASGGALY